MEQTDYLRRKVGGTLGDKEMLTECYHTMYQGMIKKDMQLLDESLDDSFVLVHMTGMRQNKKQYMEAVADGTLNYYLENTEHMKIVVHGDTAQLVGQSRVSAAVFGGGKNTWRLQLSMYYQGIYLGIYLFRSARVQRE